MSLTTPSNPSTATPMRVKKSLSDESEPRSPAKRSLQRLRSLSEDNLQLTQRSSTLSAEGVPHSERAEKEIVDYMRSMTAEHQVEWGELDEVKRSQNPGGKTSKLIQILERNGVMDQLLDLSDDDDEELAGSMRPRRRAARFTHLNRLRSLSDADRPRLPPLHHHDEIESLSSHSDLDQEDELPITHQLSPPRRTSVEVRESERPTDLSTQPLQGAATGGIASALAARKAYTMAAVNKDISFKFKRARNEQSLQDRLHKKRASASGDGATTTATAVPTTAVAIAPTTDGSRKGSDVSKDLTKRLEANMARRRMSLATSEQAAKARLELRLQGRLQQPK
jgi:hypothetical protein